MAKITSPQMVNVGVKNQKGAEIQAWKIEDYMEYLKESFSFPEDQGLPRDRFEENTITVSGPKGTGKSTFVKRQLAPYLLSLWREPKIDFYDAQDIYGTIEAISKSKKLVHFICFEDAMREGFDKRTAMYGSTKISGQLYEVIRHSIKEGYLRAGYIIICIITQLYDGIDFRYRDESAFDVFKAHCRGVETKIKNDQVISDLKFWKDKSRRAKDIRYRKLGYLADSTGNIVRIFDISEHLKVRPDDVKWIKVERSPLKLKHIQMMVDWLLEHDDILMSEDKDFIFGHLYPVLDEMKIKHDFFQVGSSDFKEIYLRAKVQYLTENQDKISEKENEQIEKEKKLRKKQYRKLLQFLFNNENLIEKPIRIIKSLLRWELKYIVKKDGVNTITKKDLDNIILDAQGPLHIKNSKQEKKIGGWYNFQIPILRLKKKMTWEQIEEITGISSTTAQRMYKEGLAEWDECFQLMKRDFKGKRDRKTSLIDLLSIKKKIEVKS